jgi:hypothetical protein
MTSTPATPGQEAGLRAECLERLATALSGFADLEIRIRPDGSPPWLAARNRVSRLSEIITVAPDRDGLVYVWSWGQRLAGVSDPGEAARSIAYVLSACDARMER